MKKTVVFLVLTVLLQMFSAAGYAAEPVIYTTADENYSEEGGWATTTNSLLQGYNGAPSRFCSGTGSAKWIPELEHGTYKVSVYKVVHQNALQTQIFEILHHGKRDYAVVDFTTGEPGWVELGTYDFYGDGDDYIAVTREAGGDSNKVTRMLAVSFELVSKINEAIPENKPPVVEGEKPEIQEPEAVSDAVVPQKEGDVMLIGATDAVYSELKGEWTTSNVKGHDGKPSYYSAKLNSAFTYRPLMPAGKYRVEYYKIVSDYSWRALPPASSYEKQKKVWQKAIDKIMENYR